jgi:hypothetical protein
MLKADAQKHTPAVVSHARVLCDIAPENTAYRRILAECLYNSGQLAAAAEAYQQLLNMQQAPQVCDVYPKAHFFF